ncbi:right-handed parallel beta-helix repeat-containing protein [Hymenobacter sp. BRD67]|uniref:right-handed parallel beta-helix repeat-containing protein n=1 Tax=Hymenobacter sp. BRD67 TaxID=2675877 RepID=UPI0015658E0F|nr:right-handed parallel beta-helix repeat-containing protein [Hymenobacter sp. BRD67]QKG53818.1 right-handed parallel beta-helix repeat-containing protein [Hymenobacter sp. BRD67]
MGQLNGPEVQIVGTPGTSASDYGITLAGIGDGVQGISIYGFGNTGASGTGNANGSNIYIAIAATSGTFITNNVIGTAATTFPTNGTDPNTITTRSTGNGILLAAGTTSSSITNNLIGYNGNTGVQNLATGATGGVTITGNEIRNNALLNTSASGILLAGAGGTVQTNLVTANRGSGVDFDGSAGNILVTGNTISSNGTGGARTSGIRAYGTGNTVSLNAISNNTGSGILVRPGTNVANTSGSTTISQNAIGANGQLGIKLMNNTDAETVGTPVLNDYGDIDGRKNGSSAIGANGLLNFPIIVQARVSGANLVIAGYARPGVKIEFFNVAASGVTADGSGFGEGPVYLTSQVEGSAADLDNGTGTYGGVINGHNQGTDNTNKFSFSIPLSSLPSGVTLAPGNVITATATSSTITSEYSGNITLLSGPLPVELTAFIAKALNYDAQLAWTTASELNSDYYTVERSLDGNIFAKIGQVAAQGNKTTTTSYTYTDAGIGHQQPGQPVYYRLRQVDLNGTTAFSPVRSIVFASDKSVAISCYPVPAQSTVWMDLSSLADINTYQVSLLDNTGRQVQQWSLAGGKPQLLDLQNLPTSIYQLVLTGLAKDGSLLRQTLRLTKE